MIRNCLLQIAKKGVGVIHKPLRFLSNLPALFNNSYYRVASLGSPGLTRKLMTRHKRLRDSLAPQILDHLREKFGHPPEVAFIVLLGSAAAFHSYDDIDINIGLVGKTSKPEKIELSIVDEKGVSLQKEVEIYYLDVQALSKEDYIRFIFSKIVLMGKIPDLYADKIDRLLEYAIKEALNKYDHIISTDKRKADHLLLSACRHVYNLRRGNLLSTFYPVVRALYEMDKDQIYDPFKLQNMRNLIENWLVS